MYTSDVSMESLLCQLQSCNKFSDQVFLLSSSLNQYSNNESYEENSHFIIGKLILAFDFTFLIILFTRLVDKFQYQDLLLLLYFCTVPPFLIGFTSSKGVYESPVVCGFSDRPILSSWVFFLPWLSLRTRHISCLSYSYPFQTISNQFLQGYINKRISSAGFNNWTVS